jgi:hypothetical protein
LEGHTVGDFLEGTVNLAIYLLKRYIKNNENSSGSLFRVFLKLDEEEAGLISDLEFRVGLQKLKLGLTDQ